MLTSHTIDWFEMLVANLRTNNQGSERIRGLYPFFYLFIGLIVSASYGSVFRLAWYVFPLFVFVTAVAVYRGTLPIERYALAAVSVFMTAALVSLLGTQVPISAWKELLFIVLAPLTFLVSLDADDKFVRRLAYAVGICSVVKTFLFSREGATLDFSSFGLFNSKGFGTESGFAFPVSLLAFYFFVTGDKKLFLIFSLLAVISFKRAALLALVAASVVYFFTPPKLSKSKSLLYAISAVVFLLGLAIGTRMTQIIAFFYKFLPTTLSMNALTMGRFEFNKVLEGILSDGTVLQKIGGRGPGFTTSLLFNQFGIKQPHNDFMKIALDYGFIGASLVIASMLIMFRAQRATIALSVFTAIVWFTDNTLIYYYHNIVLFAVAAALWAREKGTPPPVPGRSGLRPAA